VSQHFKPACRHKVASASAAFKVFSYVIAALLNDLGNAGQGGATGVVDRQLGVSHVTVADGHGPVFTRILYQPAWDNPCTGNLFVHVRIGVPVFTPLREASYWHALRFERGRGLRVDRSSISGALRYLPLWSCSHRFGAAM
jgi:hypothetical protein